MKKASKNENVVELDLFAPEDFGEEESAKATKADEVTKTDEATRMRRARTKSLR